MRVTALVLAALLGGGSMGFAENRKVDFNVFGSLRIVQEGRAVTRDPRDTEFEVILSLGLPTRVSWLEFTVEAIFLPFDRASTPELEFKTNLVWLPAERTKGWLSSHFDIVDKFSPAGRPRDARTRTS